MRPRVEVSNAPRGKRIADFQPAAPNETKTFVVQVPYPGVSLGVAPYSERARANPAYSPLSTHLLYPLDRRQPPPTCVRLLRATNPPFS
jgi:hypothetical protein